MVRSDIFSDQMVRSNFFLDQEIATNFFPTGPFQVSQIEVKFLDCYTHAQKPNLSCPDSEHSEEHSNLRVIYPNLVAISEKCFQQNLH